MERAAVEEAARTATEVERLDQSTKKRRIMRRRAYCSRARAPRGELTSGTLLLGYDSGVIDVPGTESAVACSMVSIAIDLMSTITEQPTASES